MPGTGGSTSSSSDDKPKHEAPPPGEEPAIAIPPPKLTAPPADADAIATVVNGDVITRADVSNRARMFALSTGLTLTPELLARLKPQITRELTDDRLRAAGNPAAENRGGRRGRGGGDRVRRAA
ncbi:MAG: hypothetical protein WDN04_16010 [Rhodospirillales bacterium]